MKITEMLKTSFEEYGEEEATRNTFNKELNHEAGKLFFSMLIVMTAWLFYIPNDLKLHQFPTFVVSIRLGFSFFAVCLIALKFTNRFRNHPGAMMAIMFIYLCIGTTLITATAGESVTLYISSLCIVFMISIFVPFNLKFRILTISFCFLLFFATGKLFGMDFSDVFIQYSINELLSAFLLSILLAYITNVVKYKSWEQRLKLNALVKQNEKLINKAQAASKAKSNFLAKMSHEIRTPMNAITGMAELALREDISITAKEQIFTIKQASGNLLSIINDILDFSKIENGKLKIISNNYSLSSLINDVINIIRMKVMDSRLRFVVNIDSRIPNALIGDETRIRQVLLNLLSNAVKYTKEGFISFSVNGKITAKDTVLLIIDVADSGRGIKQEDIEKLFGDFIRVDLTANKNIEGTGLGLAITNGLVKAMGGNINVNSEYSKGSIFTITLPQKIYSPEPLAAVENPEEKNVLIFERRSMYADSMIYNINNLGVNCTWAKNYEELHEKLKTKDYSFIFFPHSLLENAKKALSELDSKAQIAVITSFGNAIADDGLSVLVMPVHSIFIANVLNGATGTYDANAGFAAKFNAPKARILVVDDIGTNLQVIEGLLLPYKMQIDLRLSGAEAIQAIKANRYDLVFMDHMMPEMDGIETTKRIRKLSDENPYYRNLPIIALTANAISGVKEMFMANGFNDFLSKPIDIIILNAILEKWLPKEKQEKSTEEVIIRDESDSNMVMEIEGVDVKKGITMVGGSVKKYLQTLSVFCNDGVCKIEEIKKCLEAGNYSLYTIHIHALKSASANIGAKELFEVAKELEIAGRNEDFKYIDSHNAQFLTSLKALLNNINSVILANNESERKKNIDIEVLKSWLCKLKESFDATDPDVIDKIANHLQEFTPAAEVGASVENILQNTLLGEYDKAIFTINTLLKEAK